MKGREQDQPAGQPCEPEAATFDRSAAILGHELENVLNGLLGMARLLRESGLSPEQDRWSRAIEQSGRQMRRLVSSFRSHHARPSVVAEEPPSAPALEALDGIDLLEQAVISHSPGAARFRNRLLLTVDPRLPRIWRADPCRLRQLLDNLLGNANKFSRNGEIVLEACLDGGDGLRIAVSDSGPGVEAAECRRIFEAWEQGSEQLARRHGGSGLGLYVCQQAARTMGGSISLVSPSGCGARFELRLPRVIAPKAGPEPPLSRLFPRLECQLELRGAVRQSVDGWLARLGVSRTADASLAPSHGRRLRLRISELRVPDRAGPLLLLRPVNPSAPGLTAHRLAAPIVGASLGPVLLEMALEWLWLSRDRRD